MSYARFVVALPLMLGLVAVRSAPAGSPLSSLFKQLEADPNKTYPLQESHGPWLILAATFCGDDAETQANELVIELRREFKLPAYRHSMKWDFTGKEQGRGVDEYGRPKVMRHANYEKREEIAVLVGDFSTLDDPQGQATLEKVRYLKPRCLDPAYITEKKQSNARAFAGWRYAINNVYSKDEDKKRRGPMAKAFLVTNPMISQEYFRPKGIDPFVERINTPLEHSLLHCPGRYTVKVATFTGTSVMLPKDIEQIEKGEKKLSSRLEKAAMQAHNITAALRAKGWEAYEFHDDTSSIVTVGSFPQIGPKRADGTFDVDPQIKNVIEVFAAQVTLENGVTKAQPRYIAEIPFDVDPLPIEVPQRSISSAYDRKY